MRKVIIVENRGQRQIDYLGTEGVNTLFHLEGVFVTTADASGECIRIIKEQKDFSYFKDYDLIAIHGSFLKEELNANNFFDYAQRDGKDIVIFSGENTIVHFSQSTSDNASLSISAALFYSPALFAFLGNYVNCKEKPHLLSLPYGERYKLSFMLRYQNLLWQDKEKPETVRKLLHILSESIKKNLTPRHPEVLEFDDFKFESFWSGSLKKEERQEVIEHLIQEEYLLS